jgi:hypothetical protein
MQPLWNAIAHAYGAERKMFSDSPMAKWVLLHCSVCLPAITVAERRLNFAQLARAPPMTIEKLQKAQIVDYQKAPAAASALHTEALQLLQLDLLGRVEPAAPFKNHESAAIWCQITHPGPATPASPALSTDFLSKISTEKRKKSTLRIHRTPNI